MGPHARKPRGAHRPAAARPGPQERRAQNNVALAISAISLAWAVDREPAQLAAAKTWVLTAIDYEPWGYSNNKPNIDLAAGHLLYALGWAYDLLYNEFTPAERLRIRTSLERHADLVYDAFAPGPKRQQNFTQNHDFIPTAGLAVTALALMGESPRAETWAVLARAHHHRAGQLLSPDGYYYEGMEYLDLLDRRGSCTSSTPGNTPRARASGIAGSSATGSTTWRTPCCRMARTCSTSATSGRAR